MKRAAILMLFAGLTACQSISESAKDAATGTSEAKTVSVVPASAVATTIKTPTARKGVIAAVFGPVNYTIETAPQDGFGACRPLSPGESLLDLTSLTALERPAAPLTRCDLPKGGVYGAIRLVDGTLQYERKPQSFAIADRQAFRDSLANLKGASGHQNAQIVAAEGEAGPMLLAEIAIDGAPCVAFDLYGPQTAPGQTDRVAYGALCESEIDPGLTLERAQTRLGWLEWRM